VAGGHLGGCRSQGRAGWRGCVPPFFGQFAYSALEDSESVNVKQVKVRLDDVSAEPDASRALQELVDSVLGTATISQNRVAPGDRNIRQYHSFT
jgi:hypothetical protein